MKDKDVRLFTVILIVAVLACFSVCLFFSTICAFAVLAIGIIILVTYLITVKQRIKRINALNEYLSLVCSGNFEFNMDDNCEGEISILQNNLLKVITMLRTQNEQLIKDKHYLADSLADITHQLKTPLTSIIMMSDILKDEKSDERREEFINIIQDQLSKMKWLLQNLLKLSKLDAGTIQFKNDELSAEKIINESLKPFLAQIELQNIELKLKLSDFVSIGDEGWICEAIENIIKNCLEHSNIGGCLEVTCKRTPLYGLIKITDNGSGIDKDEISHIFERFYHGKNATADSVGIGLALSQSIIEKHNGKIEVESSVGEGTTFLIKLPV